MTTTATTITLNCPTMIQGVVGVVVMVVVHLLWFYFDCS